MANLSLKPFLLTSRRDDELEKMIIKLYQTGVTISACCDTLESFYE